MDQTLYQLKCRRPLHLISKSLVNEGAVEKRMRKVIHILHPRIYSNENHHILIKAADVLNRNAERPTYLRYTFGHRYTIVQNGKFIMYIQ